MLRAVWLDSDAQQAHHPETLAAKVLGQDVGGAGHAGQIVLRMLGTDVGKVPFASPSLIIRPVPFSPRVFHLQLILALLIVCDDQGGVLSCIGKIRFPVAIPPIHYEA